jgi:hypothetical protein
MPGQVFVDAVVDDLPQQVMQAARVDTADVHGRTPTDGIQTFDNFDVLSGVTGIAGRHVSFPVRQRH